MSNGPTNKELGAAYDQHGRDIVSLRDYFDTIIKEFQSRVNERFEIQEKAVCVTTDTPILCADLIWRPAGELQKGDELIAFDEEAPPYPDLHNRLFRKATVTANSIEEDKLLLVTTPKGVVRCNPEHPWLVRRHKWQWVKASDLKTSDEVMYIVDVWEVDKSWEAGWLAGMFDGEGCLYFDRNDKARLSIVQRISETFDRIDESLKTRIKVFGVYQRRDKPNEQPKGDFQIDARADVMKILGSVRPPRLMVNSDKVWENKSITGKNRITTVTSVEDAGTGEIALLGTSTKTYIAGGFAMHNTVALAGQEKAVQAAISAADRAVTKAEVATEKRFDAVNEFRSTLSDQAATLMPRVETEIRLKSLGDQIEVLNRSVTRDEGRSSGIQTTVGTLVTIAGLFLAFLSIVAYIAFNVGHK